MEYSHFIVVGTRKSFQMTNLYKLFCQRKCTGAAAYNLPAHVYHKGLYSTENVWEFFCQTTTPGFKGPIEALPIVYEGAHVDMQSVIALHMQQKPHKES